MSNLAGNLWAAQRFAHDFDPWLSAELNRLANRAREGRRVSRSQIMALMFTLDNEGSAAQRICMDFLIDSYNDIVAEDKARAVQMGLVP
jgi:hypothetical protein